jgi:excisionase family DNA binding protein
MESTLIHNLNPKELALLFQDIKKELTEIKKNLEPKQATEYLTRAEVCSLLDIDQSTVYLWCKKGKLNSYGIGNRVYFKRSEVEAAVKPLNQKAA